jgi:hypothetical protein
MARAGQSGVGFAGLKVATNPLGVSEPPLSEGQFPWGRAWPGIIAGLLAGILAGLGPALRAVGIPIAPVTRP